MTASLDGVARRKSALPADPAEVRERLRQARERAELLRLTRETAVLEAWYQDDFGAGDLWGRVRDRDGTEWVPLSSPSDRRHGANWPLWRTEQELDDLRQRSRILCESNGYAIGLLANLTNYTVGEGGAYKVVPKDPEAAEPKLAGEREAAAVNDLVRRAQDVVDAFLRKNRWNGSIDPGGNWVVVGSREREVFRRVIRDGECFLRFHEDEAEKCLHVRFLEPEQIRNPPDGLPSEGWSYGVRHRMEPFEDVECPEEYHVVWMDATTAPERAALGELVDAREVLHVKSQDCDSTVKRGVPAFSFDVLDTFSRAAKLQRNLSIGAAIRAATAEIWQHHYGTQSEITALAAGLATYQQTDPGTGRADNVERLQPGGIRRIPVGQELVPQPQDWTGSYLQGVGGDLRLGAAAFCAPEYWLGDASNGNYSSLETASAPTVKAGKATQEHFKTVYVRVVWRALQWAVECGELPPEALGLLKVQCELPAVLHRNDLERAQEDAAYVQMGAKSIQTICGEKGWDYETEQANIEEHSHRSGAAGSPLGLDDGPAGEPPGPGVPGLESRLWESDAGDEAAADRDPDAAAGMIADILYGVYGEDALRMLQGGGADVRESRLLEGWAAEHHPRGKDGRFIKKGSSEAGKSAHEAIGRALKGDAAVHADALVGHLAILNVKQLQALHREHGVKAPGRLRAQLVESIRQRLGGGSKPDKETADGGGPRPAGDGRAPAAAGGEVAAAPGGPGAPGANQGGAGAGQPARPEAPGGVPGRGRVPAPLERVNQRLDRYEQHFRAAGNHKVAEWMGLLREHVNGVGVEHALESLGAQARGPGEKVQYGGHSLEGNHDAHFIESYLGRAGVNLIQGAAPAGDRRAVSTVAPSSDADGLHARGDARDVFPALQTLRDKLHEAQHLPGLERSEDLSRLMGGEFGARVSHFTPDVVQKLDDVYGEGKWIVKSYGDEAYAGYGIFFPQRVQQLRQDAQAAIWSSGADLARYGFSHLRDAGGRVVGIRHQGGDEYRFGTPAYEQTIQGDARRAADQAAAAAADEHAAAIPEGRFMAQPAFPVVGISNEERAQGVTFKRGQEGRVHVVTRNGKAEIVPHSTWLKQESLPVVFENDDTRAMAQAAVDAINALPESERRGQLYAPDVVRTADGYRVVEANPANEAGASGYLQDNPLVIDSYVAHLTGREPAHVAFIRSLLTSRGGRPRE